MAEVAAREDEPYFLGRKYWHIAHPAHGRILFQIFGMLSLRL